MSAVVVLGLDDVLTSHLTRALVQHARWCRANGISVPAPLVEMLNELASAGQRRPTVAAPVSDPHDDLMLLAVTYEGAAHRLGVSERSVRRLVAAGKLRAVDVAGCPRIRASDLSDYVEGL